MHERTAMASSDCDLLIVGTGIAGLYAALLAAGHCRVALISKSAVSESNTRYAQGGIAAALGPEDSAAVHLHDTIAAGDGLCDPQHVKLLTDDALDCMLDLIQRGVPFDRDSDGFALTLEAAHLLPRVLHAGGDATGAAIQRTLEAALSGTDVALWDHTECLELLTDGEQVRGAVVSRKGGDAERIRASRVILATGGAGRIFARTTNPSVATGDGVALSYRAGAELSDLEFMQFHPTALAIPGAPAFLISEAVRGEGGILRDLNGEPFMARYHPEAELAKRDVVARAIHLQAQKTGQPHVLLDITHLSREYVERRFPTIVRACREYGVDPVYDSIPVAPAAHYYMGGVRTDGWARTNIRGLYACGEVACTGVHGANRLASNSLLEGLVFARRAVRSILELGRRTDHPRYDGPPDAVGSRMFEVESILGRDDARDGTGQLGITPVTLRARQATVSDDTVVQQMWRHASLVRSGASLHSVLDLWTGDAVMDRPDSLRRLGNLDLVSQLLVRSALVRQESRGAHFRSDFPERLSEWQGHVVVSRDGIRWLPVQPAERPLEAMYGPGRE